MLFYINAKGKPQEIVGRKAQEPKVSKRDKGSQLPGYGEINKPIVAIFGYGFFYWDNKKGRLKMFRNATRTIMIAMAMVWGLSTAAYAEVDNEYQAEVIEAYEALKEIDLETAADFLREAADIEVLEKLEAIAIPQEKRDIKLEAFEKIDAIRSAAKVDLETKATPVARPKPAPAPAPAPKPMPPTPKAPTPKLTPPAPTPAPAPAPAPKGSTSPAGGGSVKSGSIKK